MTSANSRSLLTCLSQLVDPRKRQGQKHDFRAMLTAIICATLCGVRGFRAIAQWARSQETSTWHWLGFKWKPPCANCYADLLKLLDAEEFERVIREWTASLEGMEFEEDDVRAISIDGKTLCGTLQRHSRAMHLLSAYDHKTGYVLSQAQVDPQTNEAKAALQLLKSLVLKGNLIIGDAMFCQREVCQQILDSGGDYFVVVKENQPKLSRDIALAFADSSVFSPLPTT